MYYRRKLLLGTLDEFGGMLNNTKFQKILFLITEIQIKKSFDFVPYKYGCFSFQANQDLKTLQKYKLVNSKCINKSTNWVLNNDGNSYFYALSKEDQSAIRTIKREYSNYSTKSLLRYTYLNYPYFATKSNIAEELLNSDEMNVVKKEMKNYVNPEFFTIGYEGISLEKYLNKLILNDVKLLCDIRKNPLSMKYGFSKSQLKNACESMGIAYEHIPELGIDSDKRQNLNTLSDYKALFFEYERTTLATNQKHLDWLMMQISKYKRVAITCFEKEVCMCHRGSVLNALKANPKWEIPYKHL